MAIIAKLWIVMSLLMSIAFDKECYKFSLNREYFGRRLNGHISQIRQDVSISQCAVECYLVTECVSFNYQTSQNWCELNSGTKTSTGPSEFLIEPTFLYSDLSVWPKQLANACAEKPCQLGERCQSYSRQRVCESTPTHLAQTCSMVKKMSPEYSDGEYWLYSALLKTNIKVYCHNMASSDAKEYITLPSGNNHASVGGSFDNSPYWQPTYITFSKVGLIILSMTLAPNDFTFSDHDVENSLVAIRFGLGKACIGNTGTGSFSIDTTGTGLIIDPSVEIKNSGWNAYMDTSYRSDDGTQLQASCGGSCGSCATTQPMTLQLNENEDIGYDDATSPTYR